MTFDPHTQVFCFSVGPFWSRYRILVRWYERTGALEIERYTRHGRLIHAERKEINAEAGRTEVRSSAKCLVDIYQPLFHYLHNELGALALESQMQDILNICKDINAHLSGAVSASAPSDCSANNGGDK